jgi:hypothetical protein
MEGNRIQSNDDSHAICDPPKGGTLPFPCVHYPPKETLDFTRHLDKLSKLPSLPNRTLLVYYGVLTYYSLP